MAEVIVVGKYVDPIPGAGSTSATWTRHLNRTKCHKYEISTYTSDGAPITKVLEHYQGYVNATSSASGAISLQLPNANEMGANAKVVINFTKATTNLTIVDNGGGAGDTVVSTSKLCTCTSDGDSWAIVQS